MPLLDHLHPPLHPHHHWESFHSNWATRLADELNDNWLPEDYIAEEQTHAGGHLEIDVATFAQPSEAGMAQPQQGGQRYSRLTYGRPLPLVTPCRRSFPTASR